uniref:Methyltransferase type 11 domain-containing protein n=1 Tax=Arcella intermedia TaxID=1963864 RepID=A0A6B2LH46_9EUKA
MDIGSGLGVDVIAMAKELAQRNPHGGKVIGVDFNTEMTNHANALLEKEKPSLPPNVSISFLKEDCTKMAFLEDNSVDLVRSDITLMHLKDPLQTLKEIKRVLKPGGYFLSLEGGGPSGFYTTDTFVKDTYNSLMPPNTDGGIGVKLWFWCQELGLENVRIFPETIIHTDPGEQDPGWVKLRGLGEMIVKKGAITREVADEYIQRYIKAAEAKQIITVGTIFLTQAQKPNQ